MTEQQPGHPEWQSISPEQFRIEMENIDLLRQQKLQERGEEGSRQKLFDEMGKPGRLDQEKSPEVKAPPPLLIFAQ